MGDPMDLTISQRFELERMRRTIDETSDVVELQKLAKMLLQAWHSQKAATGWMMRRGLATPWANVRGSLVRRWQPSKKAPRPRRLVLPRSRTEVPAQSRFASDHSPVLSGMVRAEPIMLMVPENFCRVPASPSSETLTRPKPICASVEPAGPIRKNLTARPGSTP